MSDQFGNGEPDLDLSWNALCFKGNQNMTRANISKKRNERRPWTPEKTLELAAVGCLLAGAVGILKAAHMEHASDALLCLFGSFGTCGFVCYLYFGPGSSAS
jgi:hypothetical protein